MYNSVVCCYPSVPAATAIRTEKRVVGPAYRDCGQVVESGANVTLEQLDGLKRVLRKVRQGDREAVVDLASASSPD